MSFIHCFDVFLILLILLSITLDFETSLLSVSVEKATQKIFRVETVIERKFVFIAIVFNFLIISSNEIAISNRKTE